MTEQDGQGTAENRRSASDIDLSKAIEAGEGIVGVGWSRQVEDIVRSALPHILAAIADEADAAIELGDSDATLEWLHAKADEAARG